MTSERRQLPVVRACELLSASHSLYYERKRRPPRGDTQLQDEIERIVLQCEGYGYRRVTAELRRRGYRVNHKRVLGIMRRRSWLCKLWRRGQRTTQSDHGLPIYRNLLTEAETTGLNQVSLADITYIRLPTEFVFLAAVLDAHSREDAQRPPRCWAGTCRDA